MMEQELEIAEAQNLGARAKLPKRAELLFFLLSWPILSSFISGARVKTMKLRATDAIVRPIDIVLAVIQPLYHFPFTRQEEIVSSIIIGNMFGLQKLKHCNFL